MSAENTHIPRQGTGNRLSHFPVSFFAIGMGMMGLTIATHTAKTAFAAGHMASSALLGLSIVVILAVAATYALKALRHGDEVRAEWQHPIRIAFFPAISISMLLVATGLLHAAPALARPIWLVGMAAQGVLALAVISSWIGHRPFRPGQLTPAWFIPAVGNVVVPLAGAPLGYGELSWLFFSGGVMFWIVLLTLVMNRLMFHEPMPEKLVPTLMILVAPPAVAYVAWVRLTGTAGPVGQFLLSAGYVFALVVATQAGKLRRIPFALSWWALSFPLAALAIASFLFARIEATLAHEVVGVVVLLLLIAVVAGLVLRTIKAIARHEICHPE